MISTSPFIMASIGTDVIKAADILKSGGVVAVPTETVYGLAANALNEDAVLRVFEIKKRPHFDPLILHIADWQLAGQYVTGLSETEAELFRKFSPGPLTLLLPKRNIIPDLVTSGLDTVAVRIPSHPLMQQLLQLLPFPLAAPSANPFGYVSPTTAAHVQQNLGENIAYILDGGPCEVGIESTILKSEGHKLLVYRQGGVPVEAIQKAFPECKVVIATSANPLAPGMLKQHYAPLKKLVQGDVNKLLKTHQGKVAVISFSTTYSEIPAERQQVLSPTGDLRVAATRLFAAMRQLDASDCDIIFAENFPNHGLGVAINDRLQKASS